MRSLIVKADAAWVFRPTLPARDVMFLKLSSVDGTAVGSQKQGQIESSLMYDLKHHGEL